MLLVVVWLTGRALQDALTGWIAAALLATNLLWLAVSHMGRQEIWLAVFVWTAVWLSLLAQKRRSIPLALLAGVTVALSADLHPLGALACLALGMWWLTYAGARRAVPLHANRRLLAAFILGGLIGTAYYLVAHVLPDPGYFLAGLRDELVSYGAEGSTPLAAMLARSVAYFAANPLEFLLLIIGALLALRRTRGLATFIAALLLLYALLVADPNPYYPIVWVTGMVILTAVALRRARWRVLLIAAFAAAIALNLVWIDRFVSADWNQRVLDTAAQVAAAVPPDQRGMSESFLYLSLRDPRFIGFTFVNYWADSANLSRWEVVQMLQPDWIVTVRDQADFAPPFNFLSVDPPNVHLPIPDAALAQAYRLTDTLSTSVGGFEIWQRKAS